MLRLVAQGLCARIQQSVQNEFVVSWACLTSQANLNEDFQGMQSFLHLAHPADEAARLEPPGRKGHPPPFTSRRAYGRVLRWHGKSIFPGLTKAEVFESTGNHLLEACSKQFKTPVPSLVAQRSPSVLQIHKHLTKLSCELTRSLMDIMSL